MAEIHSITVYLGATIPKNPIYVDAVRKLGRLMAAHGLTLVFGGSKEGTMEILADEILHNGGKAGRRYFHGQPSRRIPVSGPDGDGCRP